MFVIPDKEAHSCQAAQDGGAPPRKPVEEV